MQPLTVFTSGKPLMVLVGLALPSKRRGTPSTLLFAFDGIMYHRYMSHISPPSCTDYDESYIVDSLEFSKCTPNLHVGTARLDG